MKCKKKTLFSLWVKCKKKILVSLFRSLFSFHFSHFLQSITLTISIQIFASTNNPINDFPPIFCFYYIPSTIISTFSFKFSIRPTNLKIHINNLQFILWKLNHPDRKLKFSLFTFQLHPTSKRTLSWASSIRIEVIWVS